MEETKNSIKDALKERLTNPFLGKLFLSWIIWNWKITYVTFFVSEDKLNENRLEFVSDYLQPNTILDGLNIYFIPLLITAFLIWVAPYLSNLVYNVSENRRKERAIKKKKIDNEISGYKEDQILKLQSELSNLRIQLKKELEKATELNHMAEYLGEEPNLVINKNYEKLNDSYLHKFRKEISETNKREKIFSLLEGFHSRDSNNYFNEIERKDQALLITNDILEKENYVYYLTKYGEFISKNILYKKYSSVIPNFDYYTIIDD